MPTFCVALPSPRIAAKIAGAMQKVATSHEDLIHDVQLDYYGKRMATCSSDRTVKVYDVVEGGERRQVADLKGHDGPVWQVAWAHPMFGNLLASCSYDRQVLVWKEHSPGHWAQVYQYGAHEGSVNSIAWCPSELGLQLACASSDEWVSVLAYSAAAQNWDVKKFHAHKIGCNAASWAPAVAAGTTGGDAAAERRLVTGGCDNLVKIWRCTDEGEWEKEKELAGHSDWVRDVAWAPSLGASESMIASCSQDKKVIIWTRDAAAAGEWARKELLFSSAVWRVSWSVTGNILAVSSGDNQVTLWKETLVGEWEQVGQLSEDGSVVKG